MDTKSHRRSASDGGKLSGGGLGNGSLGGTGEAWEAKEAAACAVEGSSSLEEESGEEGDGDESVWSGVLFKWTNYIHGWQPRYFSLAQGTLAYYKSEAESCFGCRGALKLERASVEAHDLDECRFQVSVMDSAWYLRANNAEEREQWLRALEASKAESGYGSSSELRRHGSSHSLSNRSLASTSSSSTASSRRLREKIAELHTFRDIVLRQVSTLQAFFDAQAAQASSSAPNMDDTEEFKSLDGSSLVEDASVNVQSHPEPDFKGEALTFRATTSGILATVEHCAELLNSREELWRRRLERETERRRRAEARLASVGGGGALTSAPAPPDLAEGPHSALKEEEWHDALDAALDEQDAQEERLERRLAAARTEKVEVKAPGLTLTRSHPLFNEVERTTVEQVEAALAGVGDEAIGWELFAEDGEMRMYKREETREGMVVDPLKAVHFCRGVSAREYCHYFFGAEYKLDWDSTLEEMSLVERISDDTLIIHQIHKKVWPAAQRESLFWSHMRRSNAGMDADALDCWVVANQDCTHPKAPLRSGNLRVGLTVSMVCQTVACLDEGTPLPDDLGGLRREDVGCRIAYQAQVNPGGWAPASALRVVYRREYPKFLKRFTAYVLEKTQNKPLQL